MSRIPATFSAVKKQKRAALITFIAAGDPSLKESEALLHKLPKAGADIIELGMPFSDPMADGPTIQAASQRALKAGITVKKTLAMVARFRKQNNTTPIILMGYINPLLAYGLKTFIADAKKAGVDGLIVVDLPMEEEAELTTYSKPAGIDLIHLIAPTTPLSRAKKILKDASGFTYYISITGITGTASAKSQDLKKAVQELRSVTSLPIAIGFGIKSADEVKKVSKLADAVVVGSALIQQQQKGDPVAFVKSLAAAL